MSQQKNSDTISERRLRPIYDWLDNGNNKKALQEADKVLRKQPDFQCCRALKGLALMRLGKEDESIEMLDKILAESPVDEGALQAMTIGYRELKLPNKICTLYENATKKEPTNEEFLSHLFMAYVRLGQLKKQQATAMNLYKAKLKNPYYFWSVMSLVLQAIEGDEKMAQTVSLPLANRMVEKMEKDGKMEQEQETMIYLMIRQLRKDWSGALDVLNGPLGKKLENSASYHAHCISKRIELEERLENWTEVARLTRNVLLSQPDSWDTIVSYVAAVHNVQERQGKGRAENEVAYDLKPNRIDRSIEEAESLMTCLGNGYPGLRGPYLAKLEICYRMKDSDTDKLQELLIDYIQVFGSRPVCFSDIKKYLKAVPAQQRNDFILRLRDQFPDQVPATTDEIYREICLSGIERFLGKHLGLSTDVVERMVTGLLDRYVSTQPLVAHMLDSEIRPSDGYIVIASHLLWEKWMDTRANRFFMLATAMLRLGLTYSPSNWQLMIFLVRFYGRVGGGGLAEKVHAALDVKHLMLDTLGWILPRILSSSGQVDKLDRMYAATSRFYSHSPKETTEYIIQAYKCGNFPQIVDIHGLKRRIQHSFLVPLVEVERLILQLAFKTEDHPQAVSVIGYPEYITPDPIGWAHLRDNRDFSALRSYEPDSLDTSEQLIESSFKGEVCYLKLRHFLLKGLVHCLFISDDVLTFSGDTPIEAVDLNALIAELGTQQAAGQLYLKSEECLQTPQAPYRSRLNTLIPSGELVVVTAYIKAIADLNYYSDINLLNNHQGAVDTTSFSCFDSIVTALDRLMDLKRFKSESPMIDRWEDLEHNQYVVETACIATILSGAILAILRSSKGGKKKKKKVVVAKFESAIEPFTKMLEKLEQCLNNIKTAFQENHKTLTEDLSREVMIDNFAALSVNLPDLLFVEKNNILELLTASYKSQLDQMTDILDKKLSYLQTLKISS